MEDNIKKLQDEISSADIGRVENYIKMLDRILLYSVVVKIMPQEHINDIVKLWTKIITKTIDEDATQRTMLIESTRLGRVAKYKKEPDGEALRLHCLKQLKLAQKIADVNLRQDESGHEF